LIPFNDMIILTKQKGDTLLSYPFTSQNTNGNEEYLEQGKTLKVILQCDLSKFQYENKQSDQLIILTTKQQNYNYHNLILQFTSPKEAKEWISMIQETKEKLGRLFLLNPVK